MSAPYREAGGTKCPRCAQLLELRAGGDLGCAAGCGVWIAAAKVRELLGTTEIARLCSSVLFHKATPLPPTRCMVCRAPLDDLYTAIRSEAEVLTLGVCARHGVWIERNDRTAFDKAYAVAIGQHRAQLAIANARKIPSTAELADMVEVLQDRISALEARVAELEDRDR